MPKYTNDDYLKYINENVEMNSGMKDVRTFMTEGKWEEANADKKKQMLNYFLVSKAKKLAGLKFGTLLPDINHSLVQDIINDIATNVKDGKDAWILLNDREMNEVAFPSFSADIGASYRDQNTVTLVKDSYDAQKEMIRQVALGYSAADVFADDEEEIEEYLEQDADDLEMAPGGEEGLQHFLYGDDLDENVPKDVADELYGYKQEDEELIQEPGQEKRSIGSIEDDEEIELPNMNVNLNDLYGDINDPAPGKDKKEEIKEEKQPQKEEVQGEKQPAQEKPKKYTGLSVGKAVDLDYKAPVNEAPAGDLEKTDDEAIIQKKTVNKESENEVPKEEPENGIQEMGGVFHPYFDRIGLGENSSVRDLLSIVRDNVIESKTDSHEVSDKTAFDMATQVVGDAMLSRGAVKEGGIFGTAENVNIDEVNNKIDRMRKKIMADPVFKKLIDEGGTSRDFSERYLEARKKDISRRAVQHKDVNSTIYLDNDERISLTAEEKKELADLHKQMKAFNEGVVREGYNADMMNSLKNVNDKAEAGMLTKGDMADLRYYSAKYFKKREGIFFSPRTDKGKDRLEASGKIYDLSSKVMDNVYDRIVRNVKESADRDVQEQAKKKTGPKLGK